MQWVNPKLSYMSTLHPLNFNYGGTEVIYAEAANREFDLDKKAETNVKQDGGEKRTQNWEVADLGLIFSSLSH